jgi:hypothetical protein
MAESIDIGSLTSMKIDICGKNIRKAIKEAEI